MGWTSLLVIVGELLVGFLPFFWPRKTGSFGGTVNAGNVSDFKVGQVTKSTEGKCYISRGAGGLPGAVAEVSAPGLHGTLAAGRQVRR